MQWITKQFTNETGVLGPLLGKGTGFSGKVGIKWYDYFTIGGPNHHTYCHYQYLIKMYLYENSVKSVMPSTVIQITCIIILDSKIGNLYGYSFYTFEWEIFKINFIWSPRFHARNNLVICTCICDI